MLVARPGRRRHDHSAAGALAIGACQTTPAATPAPGAQAEVVDVRRTMIDGVNPAALAIWEVGNAAVDDEGMADASKLDAATLTRLREAAQMLATYAALMAEAPTLRAGGPDPVGGKVPEGIATREQIQAAIDANPEGFRAYSRAMGAEAEGILAAIAAGDIEALAAGSCRSTAPARPVTSATGMCTRISSRICSHFPAGVECVGEFDRRKA